MSEVIDTPTIPTAVTELLTVLCERYPETFKHDGEPPRPLAIGIGARLVADLALEPAVVNNALRLYTRRRAYQQALAQAGAMRIDLAGQPTEPVTPEHQTAARAPRPHQAATPGQPDAAPVDLTLDLWKGLKPMPVAATLKIVLRDLPATRESGGMLFMALQNEPRGLPKGITLDPGPLYLTANVRQWRTACTKAAEIRASGTPALLIVEAHVSTREGALIGVIKTLQVVEGKAAAPTA